MDGTPLIPSHRIRSFGPKRLKPLQGQSFDLKSRSWRTKNPKKSPDPRDREKLLAKSAEVVAVPVPAEAAPFDWKRYSAPPGRVLLRVGRQVTMEKGVVIPDASDWREQAYTVLVVGAHNGSVVDFMVGDRVLLDANSHQRPAEIDGPGMVLVKIRRVAAVLTA